MGPPSVRHTQGYVVARIPEAHVQVLFAGHTISLRGPWVRGGEGLAPEKGIV